MCLSSLLGTTLNLTLSPLVNAIAAGNCAVLKPSEFSVHTSNLLKTLFERYFNNNYIRVILGEHEVSKELTQMPFDMIFYTGSTKVGKLVMAEAAKNLTKVVLELGGKSPVIVCKDANLEFCAKRVAFGKILNSGQTCVAPDFVLVDKKVSQKFCDLLKIEILNMLGSDILNNPAYPKIINKTHLERLKKLLKVVIFSLAEGLIKRKLSRPL